MKVLVLLGVLFAVTFHAYAAGDKSWGGEIDIVKDSLASQAIDDEFNFIFKISEVEISNGFLSSNQNLTSPPESTMYAVMGVRLLPNSWNIDITYSHEIAKNVVFGPEDDWSALETATYVIDEGEISLNWIDIYMKPISTKYGEVGFGYKHTEQNNILFLLNDYSVINRPNVTQTGALLLNQQDYVRDNSKFETLYVTYNLPMQNAWYDGFGVSLGYEQSDILAEIEELNGFVLHPDNTSTILSVGINRKLDDVKSGFGLKTFRFGTIRSTHKFYNYNTSRDESYSMDGSFYDIEFIYMYKPGRNKQYYASIGRLERWVDSGDRDEFLLDIGVMF